MNKLKHYIPKLSIIFKNWKTYFQKCSKLPLNQKLHWSYNFIKERTIPLLFLLFSCWIYKELEPTIRELIIRYVGAKLILISDFINNHTSINTLILTLICISYYKYFCKIWNNMYYSIYRFIICIILLYILSFHESWIYNKLPLINITYDVILKVMIIVTIFTGVIKKISYIYHYKVVKQTSKKQQAYFTNDEVKVPDERAIRRLYAQSIIKQLLNTDISKESFALALTGEWGSGKSTFLMCITEEIENTKEAYVIKFNPWNSMSPQTLIQDFFQQLNNYVSRLYSPLEKSIFSYAYALTKIDIEPNINQIMKLIPAPSEKNLDQLKKNVEKGLKHIDKPILVIIDDIDRLEKEELFEVLRLIRNTGNFPRLIYIVAYDEKYVTQQLKHKGIYDGKLFLEKIFPAQVALPKVDLSEVYIEFKHQLRTMVKKSCQINSCFDKLQTDEINNIKRALYSFRRAKHFARQLSMSAKFLSETLGQNGFSLRDLLFVELLHYLSPSLYDILTNNPKYFLSSVMKVDSKNHRFHYVIGTEGKKKIKDFLIEQKEDMQDIILDIFYSLFKDEKSIPQGSIRWTDKYVNYMCLGVPQNKVSDLEFSAMIKAHTGEWVKDGMCAIIRGWCLSDICKKDTKSIYDQFAKYKVNRYSSNEIYSYLYALFYWLEFNMNYRDILILEKISAEVDKDIYNIELHEQLRKFIIERFNTLLEHSHGRKGNLHEKIAILCAKLYFKSKNGKSLITHNDIKNIMNLNIENILSLNKWDAIDLVTNNGNRLNSIFMLSCTSSPNENGDTIYENPIAMDTINWLALHTERSRHIDELEQLFDTILPENEVLGARNKIQKEYLKKLFGSTNSTMTLKYFKSNCFTPK